MPLARLVWIHNMNKTASPCKMPRHCSYIQQVTNFSCEIKGKLQSTCKVSKGLA